jgi:hypothetical protein
LANKTNDLESHGAPEVGIDGFVGYSHAAMTQFQGLSFLISENRVMRETELGRGIRRRFAMARQVRDRIALGFENTAQGANWAGLAVVR